MFINTSDIIASYRNSEGKFHRLDGPAVITKEGNEYWLKNGVKHREDGPAVTYNGHNQTIYAWRINGELHREDGPAMITVSKNDYYGHYILNEWYIEGKRHNDNGVAYEYKSDDKTVLKWYKNDKLHREDDYAIMEDDSENNIYKEEWYFEDKLHREDGPAVCFNNGNCERYEWWVNGVLHRENEPAITNYRLSSPTNEAEIEEWFINGKRHREDGPAVCFRDDNYERYEWWENGKRHREDGPAIIDEEKIEYYLNNEKVDENQIKTLIKEKNEQIKNALLDNTNMCKDVCGIISDYVFTFN